MEWRAGGRQGNQGWTRLKMSMSQPGRKPKSEGVARVGLGLNTKGVNQRARGKAEWSKATEFVLPLWQMPQIPGLLWTHGFSRAWLLLSYQCSLDHILALGQAGMVLEIRCWKLITGRSDSEYTFVWYVNGTGTWANVAAIFVSSLALNLATISGDSLQFVLVLHEMRRA